MIVRFLFGNKSTMLNPQLVLTKYKLQNNVLEIV